MDKRVWINCLAGAFADTNIYVGGARFQFHSNAFWATTASEQLPKQSGFQGISCRQTPDA